MHQPWIESPDPVAADCGLRSVTSASSTVRTMNTTEVPNTQCGRFWSMIQPYSSGLMIPPMLKPVETMPKARAGRARRGGGADQHVARRGNHAAEESGRAHRRRQRRHRQIDGRNDKHDDGV